MPNYFTINGKAYPATETIDMKVGRPRAVHRLEHQRHPPDAHPRRPVHRRRPRRAALTTAQQFQADTINVGPGQRYDVLWNALEPGQWLIHCHINHHTTNNNVETDGAGGLTMIINVTE
jgi:FtsP/CotA-like multicopper oxidase with cupredoxin domain